MGSIKTKFTVRKRFSAWSITDNRKILMPAGPKAYVFADLLLNQNPVIFEFDDRQCQADRQTFIDSTEPFSLPSPAATHE
jgi:hypothetical protein